MGEAVKLNSKTFQPIIPANRNVKLGLEPIQQPMVSRSSDEDLSWIFYADDMRYVIYDTNGKQLACTDREFEELILPYLNKIQEALPEPMRKTAQITYDVAKRRFSLSDPAFDVKPYYDKVAPHLEALNNAVKSIRFRTLKKPVSKNEQLQSSFRDHIENTEKGVNPNDIAAYLTNLEKQPGVASFTHLINPDPKKLDYNALNQKDLVFVTCTDKDHGTAIVFDNRKKIAYQYDPKGRNIRPTDKVIYEGMKQGLKSERFFSNISHNHQPNDNIHCGRHLLNFYKQVASPQFDFTQFLKNAKGKPIDDIIDYLFEGMTLNEPATPLKPNELQKLQEPLPLHGLQNKTRKICCLNAVLQHTIASGLYRFLLDPYNLEDSEKARKIHNHYLQFIRDYKDGKQLRTDSFLELLGLHKKEQHDPHDILSKLLNFYDTTPLKHRGSTKYTPTGPVKKREGQNPRYEKNGDRYYSHLPSPSEVYLTFELPITDTKLERLWENYFTENNNDTITFIGPDGYDYTAPSFQERTTLDYLNKDLFITVKRYVNKLKKISTPIDAPEVLKIQGEEYELRSFTVHYGKEMHGGHHVTHAKEGNQWKLCDDKNVTNERTDIALKAAKNAHLLYYRKKPSVSRRTASGG